MRKPCIVVSVLIMFFFATPAMAVSGDCAVSVDMWLIGESCIISGVKLNAGGTEVKFSIEKTDEDASIASIDTSFEASPIGIASKSSELGWFYTRSFFDFTPSSTKTIPLKNTSADKGNPLCQCK